jgi:hypothetical protein
MSLVVDDIRELNEKSKEINVWFYVVTNGVLMVVSGKRVIVCG